MRTFGLTGGIGTGKSTVAKRLRQVHGIPVIDADQVSREVVAVGSEGLAAIVQAFGPQALLPDGTLDRATMRARILSDPQARATLEGITHPRIFGTIRDRMAALSAQGTPVAGVEAAIMVETGSYKLYDDLVVVTCSPSTQLARVIARDDVSEQSARAMIAAQLPMSDKEAVATLIVRNDGDLATLERNVDALAVTLLAAR